MKKLFGCIFCSILATSTARADVDPLSGLDFVTISHTNNAAWPGIGIEGDTRVGRGSVGYEYRMARTEVSSSQWTEFLNAAFNRPPDDPIPWLAEPTGDSYIPSTVQGAAPGGRRYFVLPTRANLPTAVSWRTAAIYCNWLHNGKSHDRSAFLTGAYDISTFSNGVEFTDQISRSPGARYFIPSLDEWIKASHYDPDRFGAGIEGWWLYSHSSDQAPVPGAPGQLTADGPAEANFGFAVPWDVAVTIPLGAYQDVQSPWGLLDTAGGLPEWTEETFSLSGGLVLRGFDGSGRWRANGSADLIYSGGVEHPSSSQQQIGLRIAAAIPTPATWSIVGAISLLVAPRGRRV